MTIEDDVRAAMNCPITALRAAVPSLSFAEEIKAEIAGLQEAVVVLARALVGIHAPMI